MGIGERVRAAGCLGFVLLCDVLFCDVLYVFMFMHTCIHCAVHVMWSCICEMLILIFAA